MKFWFGVVFYLLKVILCNTWASGQPYPNSRLVKIIEWDQEVHKVSNSRGDNWPITWVNDTLQISSYGDGNGFDKNHPNLSLGISYIVGDPPDQRGLDIQSNIDTPEGGGSDGIKTSGLLMVNGMLYIFVRNYRPVQSNDFTNSKLGWSGDYGKTFQWADWHFSDTFGCPDFVQFGPDYLGALNDYIYILSQNNDNAYQYDPGIVLARVLKNRITDRDAYEFFMDRDSTGLPRWSKDIKNREAIFKDPAGAQRVSMAYNSGLKRFILTTSHQPENDERTHTAALGVFESEYPWGSWETIYYDDHWSGNCRTYHHRFPTKWISQDGTEMWLLFSGLDCGFYKFCIRKVKLILN